MAAPALARWQRPVASAILFLLPAGEESHWHRVDADELWQYSAGDPLELRIAPADGGPVARHRLGPDVTAGDEVQVVVPAGAWQAARPLGAWTLVGCVVPRLLVRRVRARAGGLGAARVIGPGTDDLDPIPRRRTHSG